MLRVSGATAVHKEDGGPSHDLQGTALLPEAELAGRAAGQEEKALVQYLKDEVTIGSVFSQILDAFQGRGYVHAFCTVWPC